MKNNITPELVRAALAYIPANLPRDEWARVGMAIKSEFADGVGLDLFTDWSSTADGFDLKATKSTWQSIKAGGGVGIGTLLHLAKENGFELAKATQAPAQPSPDVVARRDSERAANQQAEQARTAAAQASAAAQACELWALASPTGESLYLTRKAVQPYGVRFAPDGWLLVPLLDADGVLHNLQRIAPAKPTGDSPDKLFLKGGRKSNLWHMLGSVATDGDAGHERTGGVVLVGEGYATSASLHEATGYPVATAFDAGNLMHVCKALRKLYPLALLVVCGDDDAQTYARTGNNPGRDKATAAARAVRGLAVFPAPLPNGGSDFNDLHQAAGLDAVRAIVQAAIDAHQASQINAQAAQTAKAGQRSPGSNRERTGPQNEPGAGSVFDRFFVADGDGVYYTPPGDDGGMPRKVCGVLRVVGLARDAHDNQAALLLEFVTQFAKVRRWLMPLSMLAGDGNAYRTALLSQGFMTPTKAAQRQWLTEYLQSRPPESLQLVRHVSRVGWAGRCYVLPNETLGTNASGDTVIFHSEAGVEANFNQRGTVEQWRTDLAGLCVGNSRAAFAVATAFAGPLLAWAQGVTGGGIHYTGQTSIGKTTCFLLAASVWGKGTEKDPDSYMQKWRATSNGLEYQGEQHNDCTLILDELGQMDPGDAGNAAYMLADGMGKTRGKGAGGLRPKPTWRLLFLSSGELTLAQHMETVGKKMKGGQEVRLIPIPTEVKEGSALETFHQFATGHELSGFVQHTAARCYGMVGRAWLEYLVDHTEGLGAALRERMDVIEAQIVPAGASGQAKRGGRRFALIAAAGEMATAAGLTGWPVGEAIRAAHTCFDAWLTLRGGAGSSEKANMLRQVRSFFEAHGEARFGYWHRVGDDHASKTINRAGLRRVFYPDGTPYKAIGNDKFDTPLGSVYEDGGTVTYYVLDGVFIGEVCKGLDLKAVCELLKAAGCLIVKEPGRYSVSTKLPGIGKVRCYCITDAIHSIDV